MSATRASATRRRASIPWELIPLGLLIVGLMFVLGQRAILGAQRYAAEDPWLPPLTLAVLCLVAVAVAGFWVRRRVLAGAATRRERQAWLARVRTLDGLRALTPTAFELAAAELLRARGYQRVTHTGGSGDLCADLTGVTPRGELVVVQCKRYGAKRLVGSPEIQQFLGMMTIHHRAQRGLYVTTSGYTRHALALAQQHAPALELIDGERLAALMQSIR
jgi:restriction system protein